LKIIYFGSPDYSLIVFKRLLESSHDIVATVTQDTKKGRRNKQEKTPVGLFSEINSIDTFYPADLNNDGFQRTINQYYPDLIIVYSYGKILPKKILDIPKLGCINIHCSILPKWRGASPIQRAIQSDDKTTGVSFFSMHAEVDTGEIVSSYVVDIDDAHNTKSLQIELSNIAGNMIDSVINALSSNSKLVKQKESDASYAKKITKDEARILWTSTCREIFCKVRAFIEWPVAEAVILNEIIKIYDVEYEICNHDSGVGEILDLSADFLSVRAVDGIVKIRKLQFPGGKPITASDLKNSNSVISKNIKKILEK
tara:strand:- start:3364 stop:4299 length:936 start_codon:yes stop_codon:yes gene_type:complete